MKKLIEFSRKKDMKSVLWFLTSSWFLYWYSIYWK